MRRRLDLAASLVGRPAVIFLDEPTTGLDPAKREDMWGVVRGLVDDGSTVLLTTQYLDEADALADEITRHRPRPGHRPRHPGRPQAGRRRPDAPGAARPTARRLDDVVASWPSISGARPDVDARSAHALSAR